MNPKLDGFFLDAKQWSEEFTALRKIVLDCGLEETRKWGQACYTYNERNIVLIHGFKEYCALLFFKGAIMADPEGILIQQTENVQSARQLRFTSAKEITKMRAIVKAYVHQAIEVERSGMKVKLKPTTQFSMPEEFEIILKKKPKLKEAFQELTPGRQRGYLLHFSSAKQAATREARIEKCIPMIMEGKGLND